MVSKECEKMSFKPLPVEVDNFQRIIDDGYEHIIKYGIAFYRKDCLIKKS
jgi:hypothetical protein